MAGGLRPARPFTGQAMKIDQDLQDRMRRNPDARETVVLCCRVSSGVTESALAPYGFTVSEIQSVDDECFIFGDVRLGDLEALSAMPGLETASSAPDAQIL